VDGRLLQSAQSAANEVDGKLEAKPIWNAGQKPPGDLAFYSPKPQLGGFTKAMDPGLDNALLALRKYSRVLRHRRASADCFGANPVASALGNRPRRDPGAAVRTYHEGPRPTLKTGTF
jgi:hypothetical protein